MMTKIITSILILLFCSIAYAQPNYTAIITDPQIGSAANADKLIEVVDDINKRDSISLVVVMGNITANGKFDEFLWAQEILDGLSVPYFVVGGRKDYLLSEGKGNEISLLWGDDKFAAMTDNILAIGLNTCHPFYQNMNYLDIETKNWLNNLLENNLQKNVLVCSYLPFDKIRNKKDDFSKMVSGRHVYFANGKKLDSIYDDNVVFSLLGCTKSIEYNLIQTNNDSIYLFKTAVNDSSLSLQFSEKKTTLFYVGDIFAVKPEENPFIKWTNELLSTTISTVNESDKFFATSQKGRISCLDKNQKELWDYETNGSIYSSPIVEKDLVVAATNEGDLFTINANNGNLFQVIGIGETITSDITLVDIEHNGMKTKGICFGTAEGNFYCYELYSLELIWWNNGIKQMINSSVASVKGKVLFQDKKGTLFCLSSDNGALLWKWKANTKDFNILFKSDLIIKDNTIYFIDFDGDLHCIDALLGRKNWSIRKIEAKGKIELNEKKNEIILHSAKNKILTISLATGKVIKEITLPETIKNEAATDILIANENIYAGFTNGLLFEIKERYRFIFKGDAPIVSLNEINGNLLVTDYDGNLTMLEIPKDKK